MADNNASAGVLGSDAYSPAEIQDKVEKLGVKKARMPFLPEFMLSMVAGGSIGLGGMFFVIVLGDPTLASRAWVTRQYDATVGTDTVEASERAAGVLRVKGEDRGRAGRDVVMTLSSRVEALDIMRLLQTNARWKISSNTLFIDEQELVKKAGSHEWIPELTREIASLIKPPKPVKKAKNQEKEEESK